MIYFIIRNPILFNTLHFPKYFWPASYIPQLSWLMQLLYLIEEFIIYMYYVAKEYSQCFFITSAFTFLKLSLLL